MKMKLIIADLDGTLVEKKQVSDQTKETLKRLKEQGYLFTIATGRHMVATKELAKILEVDLPVICGNGAIIYDYKNDEIIRKEVLDPRTVEQIMDLCFLHQVSFLMYTTKYVVATEEAKDKIHAQIGYFDTHVVKKDQLKDYIDIGVFKILAIDEQQEKLMHIKKELSHLNDIYMVQSRPIFLDIGHKDTNKGNTIKHLAKLLDVNIEDVLAIGDQENDIEMIKTAGLGIAMGNGHKNLKRVADDVTDTYEQDGFTKAIKKHIFRDK
jgi:Cof subfamily protein (haloacid dehalogenase superfamily)